MYNYLGVIRKSTAIDHCVSCFFFDTKTPNLILSKNNRIEFYNLTQESISANKYINIYGKIKILLSIPNHNNINIIKDNLFVLSNDLDFCLFSYNISNNNIDTPIMGTIKEDLGKIEDNILYSFDSNKNYLLICAYKNIFKIICVNNNMRLNDKYKNYTIRFQYEKILFLSPFYYDNCNIKNDKNKDNEKDNNILTFVAIKSDFIELCNNDPNNAQIQPKIILETFQIKMDPNSFNPPHFLYKPKVVSNGRITNININATRRKALHNKSNKSNINNININNLNENNVNNNNINQSKKSNIITYNSEKVLESVNFLEILNFDDNQNISLMITHPDGLIIIFFSKYVVYYKYNSNNSTLSSSKSINYEKRKFIDYVTVDEKKCKYYVIDENGTIFLFGFLNTNNNNSPKNLNLGISLQILGKVNNCSCMAYLINDILFIGSTKCNSQLIKINENIDNDNCEKIEILEEYESLSPVSNMALINNTKEENGIEILTVSGVGKNCTIKNIKKGTKIIFSGDIEIKNIVKVFKVIINNVGNKKNYKTRNNNINYCSFVITTNIKSFIINYDYKFKIVSLNQSINFHKNELVKFVKNIKNLILIVTNLSIDIYKNDIFLTLLSTYSINNNKNKNNNNKNISPLIIKYNKSLTGLFIYYNNNALVKYNIDENNGKIINNEIILTNLSISSFDLCKYFLIYSLWDNNQIGIYSFISKRINYFSGMADSLNFTYISSIQIIKINDEYCIFLSSSIGKLFYLKLKDKININSIKNEFIFNDFIIKRSYNLNLDNFKISKIKKNNQKFLFLDTSLPCFIFFNNDNLIISNFNANYCKDIIILDHEDNHFLFIFNDKISFGSFSNTQNQNIYALKTGKTINNIKLIDFGDDEHNNNKINNNKSMKYILTIEEEIKENIIQNKILSSLFLNDINMKEISRYNFEYDNEISMTLSEINILQNDDNAKKYFVIGTGITDYKKEEPNLGHLYLIEININNNNNCIKKLQELELKGGVYKIETYQNIIYIGIKNTLYIYSLIKKNIENYFEFKLIRQCSDFTLINDIYILKETNKDKEFEENKDKNKSINEIFICDLYKSIILYKYDITNDKLSEVGRDYNLTWIYSILQCREHLTYLTDIDDNITVLEKINHSKNDKEKIKFNHKSFFNYGERINILVSTEIINKDLSLLTFQKTNEDSIELYKNINIKNNINYQDNKIKITYFGTLEGSIGYIIQLNKETYEFLYILQEVLIRKINNNGGFNYKRWRSFKDGYISIESKGFIEGEIIGEFLNYDDDYKKIIVKEMNYPWKKNINEIVHIIETLNNF